MPAPLLQRRESKKEKKSVGLRLSARKAERLEAYSKYLNIGKPEIVEAALEEVYKRDPEFLRFLDESVSKPITEAPRKKTSAAA